MTVFAACPGAIIWWPSGATTKQHDSLNSLLSWCHSKTTWYKKMVLTTCCPGAMWWQALWWNNKTTWYKKWSYQPVVLVPCDSYLVQRHTNMTQTPNTSSYLQNFCGASGIAFGQHFHHLLLNLLIQVDKAQSLRMQWRACGQCKLAELLPWAVVVCDFVGHQGNTQPEGREDCVSLSSTSIRELDKLYFYIRCLLFRTI